MVMNSESTMNQGTLEEQQKEKILNPASRTGVTQDLSVTVIQSLAHDVWYSLLLY
jgi:NAD(P)H-quinone oxidoreductase subunit K